MGKSGMRIPGSRKSICEALRGRNEKSAKESWNKVEVNEVEGIKRKGGILINNWKKCFKKEYQQFLVHKKNEESKSTMGFGNMKVMGDWTRVVFVCWKGEDKSLTGEGSRENQQEGISR